MMNPPEGHETRGPQNKKDFEAQGETPKRKTVAHALGNSPDELEEGTGGGDG